MKVISSFHLGTMYLQYQCHETGANTELLLTLWEDRDKILQRKRIKLDSLIQVKLVGDDYPKGFSTGRTMRNSETTQSLRYVGQTLTETKAEQTITTELTDKHGNRYQHVLSFDPRYPAVSIKTIFSNQTTTIQTLELLASFSLSDLSPFYTKNKSGNLLLHRYRSKWSMEGRHEVQPIEYYQLEPSWKPSGVGLEKYGQVGSMPVRGYFPYAAIEDIEQQTVWAVQLATPGSWQLEAYRLDDDLCLSGGLADFDFGAWKKAVLPNETFETPVSILTVARTESEAAQNLTSYQERQLLQIEKTTEHVLATQFNEFCTTWGSPSEVSVKQDVDALAGSGISYYIIDCGWYADPEKGWEQNVGDWVLNREQFPNGLKPVVEYIRQKGMIPGIWFEIETVGKDAAAFSFTDHLLKREGYPITTGGRRFWDLRDPWVRAYLKEKVIGFLKQYGFGYLKIDYNDNFGIGFDAKESLGESNRLQLAAVQAFIREIRSELPDLIIENCSSGGHRLEPSMLGMTDLSSYSDAHEDEAIPIIAANLHQLMLPRQALIWAVIRKSDTIRRIQYSMTNTFYGRLCLSGDIHELSAEQWRVIKAGLSFYEKIKEIIRAGRSTRFGAPVLSYRDPCGAQGLLRKNLTDDKALLLLHSFNEPTDLTITGLADWHIEAVYGDDAITLEEARADMTVHFAAEFAAKALLLVKNS